MQTEEKKNSRMPGWIETKSHQAVYTADTRLGAHLKSSEAYKSLERALEKYA